MRLFCMKNYYEKATSYENLLKALSKCCDDVRWKDSVVRHEAERLVRTYRIYESLKNGKYKISEYQKFMIHEPKEREIVATRIKDRQVQRALCDGGLYDDIVEHFIIDNPACQKFKGTDFTMDRLDKHLHRYYRKYGNKGWVLKCDIYHFFPETDHEVAKQVIAKRVEDPQAKDYVFKVIDSFGGDKGIGLGSQVSQLIELSMLDDLDHYIKEKLHIKYYIRYMDDFVLIHQDREYLIHCREQIANELRKIKLSLNKKTSLYPLEQGIRFLQWRFVLTDSGKVIRLMNCKKVYKQKRKLRKLVRMESDGKIPKGTSLISLKAFLANAKRGNTYQLRKDMVLYYNNLLKEVRNEHLLKTSKRRSTEEGIGNGEQQTESQP